jgi:hypothetical protein
MAMPPIRPLITILSEYRKFQIWNTILKKWWLTDQGITFCTQDLTNPYKSKNTDLVVNLKYTLFYIFDTLQYITIWWYYRCICWHYNIIYIDTKTSSTNYNIILSILFGVSVSPLQCEIWFWTLYVLEIIFMFYINYNPN